MLSQAQFQVQWDARVKVWPMLNIMQCEVECAGEGGEGEVGCMVGCCVWCLCAVEPRPRSQAPPVIDWEASGPWSDWLMGQRASWDLTYSYMGHHGPSFGPLFVALLLTPC